MASVDTPESNSAADDHGGLQEVLWLRSEVFEYGLLPLPPRARFDFGSLLALVKKYRHVHQINAKYYNVINALHPDAVLQEFRQSFTYSEWETVGQEDLHLPESFIRACFDRLVTLVNVRTTFRRTPRLEDASVNFYEFVLYMYLQLIGRNGYASNAARGAHWPNLDSPTKSGSASSIPTTSAGGLPSSPGRRSPFPKTSQATPNAQPSPSKLSVPPLQLHAIRNAMRKENPDRLDPGLEEQRLFFLDHLDALLRLLSADDPNGNIASHELDALSFLLASGPDIHSRRECLFSDAIPSTVNAIPVDGPTLLTGSNKPSLHYSRHDIADWISEALVINTFLYGQPQLHPPRLSSASSGSIPSSRGPHITPLEEPIGIFNANKVTLFKTDKASIPEEVSPPPAPLATSRDRKDSLTGNTLAAPLTPLTPLSPTTAPTTFRDMLISQQQQSPTVSVAAGSNNSPNTSTPSLSQSAVMDAQSALMRASTGSHEVVPTSEPIVSDCRIVNCSHCFIYLLRPISHVRIEGCRETTIVLGAVSGVIDVRNCKQMQIIAACHSIQINHCQDSSFYLLTNTRPLLLNVNHHLQFAPFNTHYRSISRHLREAQISTTVNLWDQPLVPALELHKASLTASPMRSPLRAGSNAADQEQYSFIRPDAFLPFRIPFELAGDTKSNPFELSMDYRSALEEAATEATELKQSVEKRRFDNQMRDRVRTVLAAHFQVWLRQTGNYQQLEDLLKLQLGKDFQL